MFIDGTIKEFDYYHVMWSEWLESIRKDVKCVFSNLKNRFRFLRNRVVYHDITTIYNAVHVAAILHNRLLSYDGFDNFDWEGCDPDAEEPEVEDAAPTNDNEDQQQADNEDQQEAEQHFQNQAEQEPLAPGQLTQVPIGSQQNPMPFSQGNYLPLQQALIKNLSYAYTQGKLEWPLSFTSWQKKQMPLLTRALHRVDAMSRLHFKILPSTLRRRNADTGLFTETIGNGLFAHKDFKEGDHLLNFVGTIIDRCN